MVLVLMLLIPSLPQAPAQAVPDVGDPSCKKHPRIDIIGDVGETGLILGVTPAADVPIYRPGSGILSGRGTPEDPFMIADLCIVHTALTTNPYAPAIRVKGTTMHLVISNVTFAHEVLPKVILLGVSHITVERLPLRSEIEVRDAGDIRVLDSIASNGLFSNVTRLTLTNNTFRGSYEDLLTLQGGSNIVIVGNTIRGSGTTITASGTRGLIIQGNTFPKFDYAMELSDCDDVRVEGNTMVGATAVDIRRCTRAAVIGNTITNARDGVKLTGDGYLVEGNVIDRGDHGIVSQGVGNILRGNRITNTLVSISLKSATENVLEGNSMEGGPLMIAGTTVAHWLHQIPTNNTRGGLPVQYHRDLTDATITTVEGQLILVRPARVVLTGLAFTQATWGLDLAYGTDITVVDSSVTDVELTILQSTRLRFDHFTSIQTPYAPRAGMRVYDSSNVVVTASTFVGGYHGTAFWRSTSIDVGGSSFTGQRASAVFWEYVTGSSLHDNLFVDNSRSTSLSASSWNFIHRNTYVGDCQLHIQNYGSPGTVVSENRLEGCGIEIVQSKLANVTRNTLMGSGSGIGVSMVRGGLGNEQTRVDSNNITGYAIGVVGTALTYTNNNNVAGNLQYGVSTSGATGSYNAKNNWWGCAGGPGAPGCDGIGGNAVGAPWRTTPNPAAGRP